MAAIAIYLNVNDGNGTELIAENVNAIFKAQLMYSVIYMF